MSHIVKEQMKYTNNFFIFSAYVQSKGYTLAYM